MCGISGFLGGFDPYILDRMSKRMRHRGPDDAGKVYLKDEGLGLAHRRLSIIDISSNGHQPMWDKKREIAIVFNGEIYNFLELRRWLENMGFEFRGSSDTEVLLNLYVSKGSKLLSMLNGIFAFAIWDGRSHELFVARDGMGVKPFYFCETEKGFLFASEIKSLLEEPSVSREVDPVAIASHLTYLWSPAPSSLLKNVRKLNPGSAMIVREGRVSQKWNFYELSFFEPNLQIPVEEARRLVRQKVRAAVERQMISDVPVGAFLSGGLDSSAVAAFAQEAVKGSRMQCFTIALEEMAEKREGVTADLPYAEQVAKHLGVDLHVVRVGTEMADELATMIYHLDEPQADPAALHVLFISRLAREYGMKVLLSGAGGDDIFSGYRRHRALHLERYWSWMPQGIRYVMSQMSRLLPNHPASLRRLSKAFQYAELNDDKRIASYFYWLDPNTVKGLLSLELRGELLASNPLEQTLSGLPTDMPTLNRMLLLEQKYFLADHNLNYTDKMSMATGIEVRVPLLDPDLVSLTARLPVEYKQHGREGKWIFKKAMEGILPNEVIYRPKTGFGVPLRDWLRGPLRTMVYDTLSEASLRRRGWFDQKAFSRLLKDDESGHIDGTYSIFALLCIELWAQQFLDNWATS